MGGQAEQPKKQRASGDSPAGAELGQQSGSLQPTIQAKADSAWLPGRRPVLRFVLLFALFLAGFNAFFYLYFIETDLFTSYLSLNAKASAACITVLGGEVRISGASIVSSGTVPLEIKRGCDALQASAFFVIGVLASPLRVPLRSRLIPVIVGTLFLLAMNLVRIISLYYTSLYYPKAFELMHIDVWQALFIFLPLFLWVMWARSALRSGAMSGNASR